MTDQANQKDQAPEQQFLIQRIYVKDVSFESPNTPAIYAEEWKPETNLQLNTQPTPLGNNLFEIELQLTITVKSNNTTAFLIEVTQAGVFEITGYDEEQLNFILATHCPTILFPYAREAIASLVSKGSFPEMHLSPINFEALYAQRLAEIEKGKQDTTEEA